MFIEYTNAAIDLGLFVVSAFWAASLMFSIIAVGVAGPIYLFGRFILPRIVAIFLRTP